MPSPKLSVSVLSLSSPRPLVPSSPLAPPHVLRRRPPPAHPRNSTNSWSSMEDDTTYYWTSAQLSLIASTLDRAPSHLATPYSGPIPPSNLLDALGRELIASHAQPSHSGISSNTWPHSLRSTRRMLIEVARKKVSTTIESQASSTSGQVFSMCDVHEIAVSGDATDIDVYSATNSPTPPSPSKPKRAKPLYRQNSMDFIPPTVSSVIPFIPNIPKTPEQGHSSSQKNNQKTIPHASYHPYKRSLAATTPAADQRTLLNTRACSLPLSGALNNQLLEAPAIVVAPPNTPPTTYDLPSETSIALAPSLMHPSNSNHASLSSNSSRTLFSSQTFSSATGTVVDTQDSVPPTPKLALKGKLAAKVKRHRMQQQPIQDVFTASPPPAPQPVGRQELNRAQRSTNAAAISPKKRTHSRTGSSNSVQDVTASPQSGTNTNKRFRIALRDDVPPIVAVRPAIAVRKAERESETQVIQLQDGEVASLALSAQASHTRRIRNVRQPGSGMRQSPIVPIPISPSPPQLRSLRRVGRMSVSNGRSNEENVTPATTASSSPSSLVIPNPHILTNSKTQQQTSERRARPRVVTIEPPVRPLSGASDRSVRSVLSNLSGLSGYSGGSTGRPPFPARMVGRKISFGSMSDGNGVASGLRLHYGAGVGALEPAFELHA